MDSSYLLRALALAKERRGFCAPNPSVGAVLVQGGQEIGKGLHWAAGKPHAEVGALKDAACELPDATLYVTLEPCCHHGRTPPCTDLISRHKVGTVVYAFADPNPEVAGRGHRTLAEKGVRVIHQPLPEIEAFYESYAHWTRTRLPFVTAKLALSLDGKIAHIQGKRAFLSGTEASCFTHEKRLRTDAILTTSRTVLADNPQLNARTGGGIITPKRVFVLDRNLEMPVTVRLKETAASLVVFHAEGAPQEAIGSREANGISCVAVSQKGGQLSLEAVLSHLGGLGIQDLWVEAGGTLFAALAEQGHLQRAYLYSCPHWLGVTAQSAFAQDPFSKVKARRWSVLGEDALCEMDW